MSQIPLYSSDFARPAGRTTDGAGWLSIIFTPWRMQVAVSLSSSDVVIARAFATRRHRRGNRRGRLLFSCVSQTFSGYLLFLHAKTSAERTEETHLLSP